MILRFARTVAQVAMTVAAGLYATAGRALPVDPTTLPVTALPKAGPSVAESSYVTGLKALTENRLDDADRSFRGCLEVAPKAAACMLGVATVASQRGNPQASGLWIERAAAVEPDNAHAQASLGRWRAVNGKMTEAVAALEAAIRLDPKAVRPRVDLGDIYLASGRDVDRAIKLYREAIAADDKHAGAHYALGVALTRKGDATGARTEFQRAAALSPGNPLPALGLAELFAASGDLKQAEQYAREAVKAQPSLLQGRLVLGQVLEAGGRYDEAMQQYREMGAANPKLAAPHFHVGALLHRRGDLAGAAAEYGKALKIDPEFAPALNNLAAIELTNKKAPAKGESLARRAVAAAPNNAAYRDTLAETLAAQGKHEAALAEQQQAVRLEPGNPVYLAHAGTLQARLGKKADAIDSLSRALKMSDSFPGAAEARKLLDSLRR
jgi:tetratricopeptide (TPR) repeat protein